MEQAAADFINGAGVSRRVQADRLARDLSDGVLVGEILAGRGALDLARLDANAESLHSKLNNWQILAEVLPVPTTGFQLLSYASGADGAAAQLVLRIRDCRPRTPAPAAPGALTAPRTPERVAPGALMAPRTPEPAAAPGALMTPRTPEPGRRGPQQQQQQPQHRRPVPAGAAPAVPGPGQAPIGDAVAVCESAIAFLDETASRMRDLLGAFRAVERAGAADVVRAAPLLPPTPAVESPPSTYRSLLSASEVTPVVGDDDDVGAAVPRRRHQRPRSAATQRDGAKVKKTTTTKKAAQKKPPGAPPSAGRRAQPGARAKGATTARAKKTAAAVAPGAPPPTNAQRIQSLMARFNALLESHPALPDADL